MSHVGLVVLSDHKVRRFEKAQQCRKGPEGSGSSWVTPVGPRGCSGEDGSCPLADERGGVGGGAETLPSIVPLPEGMGRKGAQLRRQGAPVNRVGEAAASGPDAGWGSLGT